MPNCIHAIFKGLIILVLCALQHPAAAQERYILEHYSNQNGLPVNGITGLEFDAATNLLWIGTEAGISCYNGYKFQSINYIQGRTYAMGRANGGHDRGIIYCATDYISHLYLVSKNRVLDCGIDSLSLFPLKTYRPKTLGYMTAAIEKRKENCIWPPYIQPLDNTGTKVLILSIDSLFYKDGNHITFLATCNEQSGFFRDSSDIFLASDQNLFRFDSVSKQLLAVVINNKPAKYSGLKFITNTNTPLPMVIIGPDLYYLKRSGSQYYLSLCYQGLPESNQITIARVLPRIQTIALGDHSGGLYLLRRKNISQLQDTSGPPGQRTLFTYAQAEISPNTVLIQNGNIIDSAGRYSKPIKGLIPDFNVYTASNGDIFYNRGEVIHYYNKRLGKASVAAILGDNSYWVVFAETLGALYAISSFGIYKVGTGGVESVYQMPQQPQDSLRPAMDNATAIEISPGNIGIACGPLMLRYNVLHKTMDTIKISENATIRALWKVGPYIFAGTYGEGIFCIKDNIVKTLPLDIRKFLKYTHCFVPDGRGYCWISTNNGLFRVSIRALCNGFENSNIPIYYHYLGTGDGMVNPELNGGCQTCAIKLHNGNISFPSMNGLVQVNPQTALTVPPPGIVLTDSVLIGAQYYSPGDSALSQIPYSFKNISFRVSIPYWGSSENLYTWYRIRNYSDDWIPFDSRTQNIFSFTSLPPGDYSFEIKILTGFLPGDYRIAAISFVILKPWYLTWWALLIDLILLSGLGLFFVKWRTARIARQNETLRSLVAERTDELHQKNQLLSDQVNELAKNDELKTRLISVISHNIITPLKYIHRAASSMTRSRNEITPALRQKATDSIRETASELGQLSINILNWIRFQHHNYALKTEQFHAEVILKNVVDMIGPIYKEKGFTVLIETKGVTEIVQYKDAVQVIIYNLLINAVSYSEAGTITLSAIEDPSGILLRVKDEGPGIAPEKISQLLAPRQSSTNNPLENKGQGFGYLIIQDLLKLCDAAMKIESETGRGTTISIAFPSL